MGKYQDAIAQTDLAQKRLESLIGTELGLYSQVVRFMSLLHLGRVSESMENAQRALEISRAVRNRKEEGRILTAMGLVALEDKEPSYAQRYLIEAVEIAREIKDLGLEARAVNNLAISEGSVNGDFSRARRHYEEAYKLAREIGDRQAEGTALNSMGFAASMEGDFIAARSYYEQALKIAREIVSPYVEVYALMNLSALAGITWDSDLALSQAQQAAELARKLSQRSAEAWAMLYMGHAYLLGDQCDLARNAYQKSIDIRIELNQPSLSMEPIAGLVEAFLQKGDLDSANKEAQRILNFLESGSTLNGTEEPLRVYYACYQLLEKQQDPRAPRILQAARELLETQASKFSDETARQRYIENIPWRRAIWWGATSS
jgi:tetratricopeptide (TPR) repeat protein